MYDFWILVLDIVLNNLQGLTIMIIYCIYSKQVRSLLKRKFKNQQHSVEATANAKMSVINSETAHV